MKGTRVKHPGPFLSSGNSGKMREGTAVANRGVLTAAAEGGCSRRNGAYVWPGRRFFAMTLSLRVLACRPSLGHGTMVPLGGLVGRNSWGRARPSVLTHRHST